jgi:glycosyltransferase involved in cell wall biosynthesis
MASFLQRHVRELLPGRTVAIAPLPATGWPPEGWPNLPVLDLNLVAGKKLRWQVIHGASKKLGLKLDREMVKRFLKKHKVKVVMGEYLDFSAQWLDIAQELGIPFFAHAHGHDVSRRLLQPAWIKEYLRYNDSGGVITINHASQTELIRLGLNPSSVRVAHYGVHVPANPPARPQRAEIRCVAVGRMVPQKAPILMLDSFRRAAGECPNLRLDYAGDGPLLPAIQEFLLAFGLGSRVVLHGQRSNAEVLEMMRQADLFIQHSMTDPNNGDQEGLPVAILEAMAQGLPVVSTRHAGIPEEVIDGSTGYLVDPGDSQGMAERVVALARDAELRRRMGLAGWQRARDCFSWERESSDLLHILGLKAVNSSNEDCRHQRRA